MKNYINHNGELKSSTDPVFTIADTAFRSGFGLFETMKIINGNIQLAVYHFQRLIHGIKILNIKMPHNITQASLTREIIELCEKNKTSDGARVRLTISADQEARLSYCIESIALPVLNDDGLEIDIYSDGIKSIDKLSFIKSTSRLVYEMAARHAKALGIDDCLLLNTKGNICDSSIANVFWIKAGKIYTPPLTEGCVAGVVRSFLLDERNIPAIVTILGDNSQTTEKIMSVNDLDEADEIFLTNAIRGIQWVKTYRQKTYNNVITAKLSHLFMNK